MANQIKCSHELDKQHKGFKTQIITMETTMKEFNGDKKIKVRLQFEKITNVSRNHVSYSCKLQTKGTVLSVVDKFGRQHMSCAKWEYYRTDSSRYLSPDKQLKEMNALYKQALKDGFKIIANNEYIGFNPFPLGISFSGNVELVPNAPHWDHKYIEDDLKEV